jgi:hypothetical protein
LSVAGWPAVSPQRSALVFAETDQDRGSQTLQTLDSVLIGEAAWIKGKKRTKLIPVPVEDNHVLIYTDLGVYTGQRLGTHCDDL